MTGTPDWLELPTMSRDAAVAAFAAAVGWGDAVCAPLAGDASFRRYLRLQRADGRRAVLMDAPPPQEDVRPFIAVAETLRSLGLSAPRILAADVAEGFLLLEDFGDRTYTGVLARQGDEAALYRLAVDVLIVLHRRFIDDATLPPYDDDRLLAEAALLVDWYLPAVRGEPTPVSLRSEYLDLWRRVLPLARKVPTSLVLRDYHVDNLMWLEDREGIAACGLLDFQDAVVGPVTYDLVSLFEDARRNVPGALATLLLERYKAAFPDLDVEAFAASYAILGAQRNAKIVGIFTRLDRRDGKPGYLYHIPRVWRWLAGDLDHPALAALKAWFNRVIPAGSRIVPGRSRR